MELSTEVPIDADAIEHICCLPDDLYRLRWVRYAYHDISERLAAGLGRNASWPTFAQWSAYTISEALRLDRVNPRLEEVLREHALPASVRGPLVEMQKRLRSLDDGAMPTVLALGNRLVFHEVGWTLLHFVQWIEAQNAPDQAAWANYRAAIEPFPATDFFREGYPEWLRDGVGAYYDAWWEANPERKAQLVLKGNILIGAYEQWRVNSFFEVALDFNPGALIKDLRIGRHDELSAPVGIRHAGTRRALRHQWALFDWVADAYAAFLTHVVLTWDAPLFSKQPTSLRLGCDLPAGRQPFPHAQNLEELDRDVRGIFESFDRSGGELRGVGARNWRRFTDRMSFIANLFRSQQLNPNLHAAPLFRDTRLLELQLDDEHLDVLRGIGDTLGDEILKKNDLGSNDPQEIAHGFVLREKPFQMLSNKQLKVDLPAWVHMDSVKRGQEFFKEHSIEIASALFTASLPKAYTAARGARVLFSTAELVSDVNRRIAETGRLLLDVMTPDPKGLSPGTGGYRSALTVRGFHAAIRNLLAHQEPWLTEWHETPINQEDLLGTLATFTVVVIEALEKMGIVASPEEREDYMHTWLVVGHLLGIDYDLLRREAFNKTLAPLTYFEMQLLSDSIFRRQAAPSPSGQILTRALIKVQEDALPRVLRPLPPAAIRRFIGDDAADMLDVPPAGPVRVLLGALGPLGATADWVAQGRVFQPRLKDMTTQMLRHWIAEQPEGPAKWTLNALDPSLHLTDEIVDLSAAEREKKESLWDDQAPKRQPRLAETGPHSS
jgi:hypothetical protein